MARSSLIFKIMIIARHSINGIIILINVLIVSYSWLSGQVMAQSHNYWTRSFNEESSLLSGAVVGGGAGPSAIYYNPAGISEAQTSSLSLNASLFSFDFSTRKNALGQGINMAATKGTIEPRFISYMIKGRKHPNWNFEIAFLNNENTQYEFTESVDQKIDILSQTPGDERYFAVYRLYNRYRDDWFCFGGSLKLSEKLFIGAGLYVNVKNLNYTTSLDIEAYSTNDSISHNYYPVSLASYQTYRYLKFNDYRVSGKLGIQYKARNYSIGMSIMTPSLGGIYADGKRNIHKESQINIVDPETGKPVPSYTIIDYKEKGDMSVSFKTPLSVAAGFTYYFPDSSRTFYSTIEFFSGITPYRIVEAEESPDIASGEGFDEMVYTEWLTYVSGARPVLNIAVGYSWTLREDLRLMAGFRTDFNYQKNFDFAEFNDNNKVESLNLDLYYLTCGLSWDILGQDIITGVQYTVGRTRDEKQIANLSDPVEYSPVEHLPLQGDRKDIMTSVINSISLYFGASFNFGGGKK